MTRWFFVVAIFLSIRALGESAAPDMSLDKGYVEPFRMFDNVYYVGDKWVSSYAVVTSSGLVIIDTLEFPYSKWIPANLEKLGLGDRKVTHIIITHGHSDHVGGAHYLQSLYDSEVVVTEKDFELTERQAQQSSDENKFLPPAVNTFAEDSSRLVVGDTEFTFYITPGHTEGCLSIDFLVREKDQLYRAFVVGGHGTTFQGLELAEKFVASIRRIRELAMQNPTVAVNLSNHPHKGNLFERKDKGTTEKPMNPFIDEAAFLDFLDDQEKLGIKKLQEELEKIRVISANKSMHPAATSFQPPNHPLH